MLAKLFRALTTLIVLALLAAGFLLIQSGHVRAWYFSYELGEVGMGFKEAEERADKKTLPGEVARNPDAYVGKVFRWDGRITDVRILQGKLKEIRLVAADGTPFAALYDRGIGELETGDTARVYGLYKNLLYSVRIDGKPVPVLLAVDVDRAPSELDVLEKIIELGDEFLNR